MKIALGCDHGGLEIKNAIIEDLKNKGVECIDFGTTTTDSVDYPVYAKKVCAAVQSGECVLGILCCDLNEEVTVSYSAINVGDPDATMIGRTRARSSGWRTCSTVRSCARATTARTPSPSMSRAARRSSSP